jgi:hypothetical protein
MRKTKPNKIKCKAYKIYAFLLRPTIKDKELRYLNDFLPRFSSIFQDYSE